MKTSRLLVCVGVLAGITAVAGAKEGKAGSYTLAGICTQGKPSEELVQRAAKAVEARMTGMTMITQPEEADHYVEVIFRRDSFDVYVDALPYTGRRISMTVVLPRKADGLAAVEKDLTAEKLAATLKTLRFERQVHVHLPKFKVEKSFTLNKPLIAMGMKSAFTGADFSGMHNGGEQLDISAVIHKAFVDVNEEGTEAAAATGVVVGVTSAAPPPQPKHFKADHPFLFFIRDQKTGSVLFTGRLENPKA